MGTDVAGVAMPARRTDVELSERTFSEFLHELLTAAGAVRIGLAAVVRDTLVGSSRTPLDLQRSFAAGDDPDEVLHFLTSAETARFKSNGDLNWHVVASLRQALDLGGEAADLPVVALDTEPGDLTLHHGDTCWTSRSGY